MSRDWCAFDAVHAEAMHDYDEHGRGVHSPFNGQHIAAPSGAEWTESLERDRIEARDDERRAGDVW